MPALKPANLTGVWGDEGKHWQGRQSHKEDLPPAKRAGINRPVQILGRQPGPAASVGSADRCRTRRHRRPSIMYRGKRLTQQVQRH